MQHAGLTPRRVIATALAAVCVGVGGFVIGARSSSVTIIGVGTRAPEFDGVTLDVPPTPRSISAYRGQVVVLNLWATWCGPCEAEMPSLQRLYERLSPRGLKVVAVSIDDPGNENRIRDFVARHGLTFDILNEGTGAVEAAYQSPGIPTTFVIDRGGIIRGKVVGATDWDAPARRADVEALLGPATR